MSVHLKIKALTPEVADRYRSHGEFHPGDSGLDLYVIKDQVIKAGETDKVKLGIKVSAWERQTGVVSAPRKNVSFLLMARSSICKTPLRLANSVGLVDAGYRGELMAVVDNIKNYDFELKAGERIVQAVGFTGGDVSFELVEELDETSRGEGGFGSTTNITTTTAGSLDGARAAKQRDTTSLADKIPTTSPKKAPDTTAPSGEAPLADKENASSAAAAVQ